MDITVKETTALGRDITICVAASQVEELLDQELGQLTGTIRLPGFRPGKIPKRVLEARFREHLAGKITEQLIKETYPKAIVDHALRPVDNDPKLNIGKVKRGLDFTYTASIEVYPNVDPQGYTALTLTRRNAVVNDADVDKAVQHIRADHSRHEADGEHKAELGDQVVLDYSGSIAGELFAGGQANNHVLKLGGGQFIPGFEEQLLGCGAGEERQVHVTFPNNYRAAQFAGKDASFECKIHEVRRRIMPPADDSLAELAGITTGGFAMLLTEIQENLQSRSELESKRQLKKVILEQLLAANATVEVPGRLLKRECQSMVAHAKQEYKNQGMDPEKLGLSDADLESGFAKAAKERLIVGMVIDAIAKKEQLTVDDATLNASLDAMTASYGENATKMKKWIRASEERLEEFRTTVLEQQVVDWISANNTVTEQTCSFDELKSKSVP